MRILMTGFTGMVRSHLTECVAANHPGSDLFGLVFRCSLRENITRLTARVRLLRGALWDLFSLTTRNLIDATQLTACGPLVEVCSSSEMYGVVPSNTVSIWDTSPLRPSDVTRQSSNVSKFRAATGWIPNIPRFEALADLFDHNRSLMRIEAA